MKKAKPVTAACQVCGKSKPVMNMMPAELVRLPVAEFIKQKIPAWTNDGYICIEDLNRLRYEYIANTIESERGDLSAIDKEVIASLRQNDIISKNVDHEFDQKLTFGQRVADNVADFGGSWSFVITFGAILAIWIIFNSITLLRKPFDPYPFILLNLILSTLAALQAPVIMMSQNRQETKDRLRSENDYKLNLKAELEIRHLNEKLDFLMTRQWQRLLDIQQI